MVLSTYYSLLSTLSPLRRRTVGIRVGTVVIRVGIVVIRVGIVVIRVGIVVIRVGIVVIRVGIVVIRVGTVVIRVGRSFFPRPLRKTFSLSTSSIRPIRPIRVSSHIIHPATNNEPPQITSCGKQTRSRPVFLLIPNCERSTIVESPPLIGHLSIPTKYYNTRQPASTHIFNEFLNVWNVLKNYEPRS